MPTTALGEELEGTESVSFVKDPTIMVIEAIEAYIAAGSFYPKLTNIDGVTRKVRVKPGWVEEGASYPVITVHEFGSDERELGVGSICEERLWALEINVWTSGAKVTMPDGKKRNRGRQDRFEIAEAVRVALKAIRTDPTTEFSRVEIRRSIDIEERPELIGRAKEPVIYRRLIEAEVKGEYLLP